jgi:LVIVD repeat
MALRSLAVLAIALLAPAAAHAHPAGEPQRVPTLVQARAAQAAPPATPRADCGPGSRPAPGLQGRVQTPPDDGYTCNTELVGREGTAGGFKVERFVDRAGRQCAYYDTTLLFPTQAIQQLQDGPTGVAVVDMSDPSKPRRTATLVTPAMQTPHESLLVNQRRGLLAAVMGNPTAYPGFIDIYDLKADCRQPRLLSSLPVGLLGHESGWSPDGNTFYATSLFNDVVTAVDVSNPQAPRTLWVSRYPSHGMTVSEDGNRGYIAGLGAGLIIVDTSEIQARRPTPQVPEISRLTWPTMSIPQVAIPVTFDGKPHIVEVDEFAVSESGDFTFEGNGPRVGAARIIDISDERNPKVISDMRLEVNNPEHRAEVGGDPGAGSALQGYAAHYCNVPRTDDPEIVACSFIASGLRVFDVRDPRRPKEAAYFVAPPAPGPDGGDPSNYAMAKPSFDAARKTIWYSDGNSGLYAVRLTNGAWPERTTQQPRRRCASRRNFLIRLPRSIRRSARVTVAGKRVRVRRGRRLRARVNLRGMSRRTVTVRVTGRTRGGKRVRQVRRFRTCTRRASRG